MFTNDSSINIYSSREQIRNQLASYLQLYLGLENVDLYKTSFVSYIIDMLSILSANQLFYSSTVYKEQFFLQAELMESVYNLAQWIGYTPIGATPSQVQAYFTIPLNFSDQQVTINIPNDFTIKANTIEFTLNSQYSFSANTDEVHAEIESMQQKGITVEILQNRIVTVTDSNGFSYPVQLSTTGTNGQASFILPFTQVKQILVSTQIPQNLQFYQFFSNLFTDINSQISSQKVYVVPPTVVLPPGIKITDIDSVDKFNLYLTVDQQEEYEWTESQAGIYTLTSTDAQYVLTKYSDQAEILFGNGVLGKQPTPGSVVFLILSLTTGASGNVIPGSITTGDPIFYTDPHGISSKIAYTVVNPSSAIGGKDSQSIEEIKNSALANLTSQKRLVSSEDYNNFNEIVTDTPLQNPIPILKRSDLKINEIVMFSELVQDDTTGIAQIIPTRNIVMVPDSTSVIYPEFYIPKGTIPQNPLDPDVSLFQTIFSMNVDLSTNSVGYEYLLNSTTVSTVLQQTDESYNALAYLLIPTVSFSATVDPQNPDPVTISVNSTANHIKTVQIQQFKCLITSLWNGEVNQMTTIYDPNDPDLITGFSYDYSQINNVPLGNVVFNFTIQGYIPYQYITPTDRATLGLNPGDSAWITITIYSCNLIIRQDMSGFMISSIDSYTDSSGVLEYRIHDVPTILTEYLNLPTFNSDQFELTVLQKLIANMDITKYRMLNDFINVKFPDTNGSLTNMKYNPIDTTIVSRRLSSAPISPDFGDTYIINGSEGIVDGVNWNNYINYLAFWDGIKWLLSVPTINDFVEVNDKYDPLDPDQDKRLIYTGSNWIEPVFNIPLVVSMNITQDSTVASSTTAIVNAIKLAIVTQMASQFGLDKNIDRSQIVQIARSVPGVKYIELLEPQVDIRFNYQLMDLTPEQVLDYTPQIVAITQDSITVKVVS